MKRLLKIIGNILLIFFGLVGLHYETGKYYEYTLNANDKKFLHKIIKIFKVNLKF